MTDTAFSLPPALVIDNCDTLQQVLSSLVANMPESGSLSLAAQDVERLTTPGMQLLCALEKTLSLAGVTLQVTGAGAAFTSACTALGFDTSCQPRRTTTC